MPSLDLIFPCDRAMVDRLPGSFFRLGCFEINETLPPPFLNYLPQLVLYVSFPRMTFLAPFDGTQELLFIPFLFPCEPPCHGKVQRCSADHSIRLPFFPH